MRLSRLIWLPALLGLLAGCAPEVRKSIFPPRASLQQLVVQPDGSWKLQVRLQNYSSVSMTFAKVQARIELDGHPAGEVNLAPALRVGPESADIVEAGLKPSPAAAAAVSGLKGSGSVRYKLTGNIATTDPDRAHAYSFEGVLSPVPGLPGVLR